MNQQCKVCGEPAAGFHFGAFTCEGCKSFFGRSYNNLSSISECKNNGECVINKKNRTSCKACRLRKCLLVGMSKSGSRYGRRSNWFKIHCLLQEQQQQQAAVGGKIPVTGKEERGCYYEDYKSASVSSPESHNSDSSAEEMRRGLLGGGGYPLLPLVLPHPAFLPPPFPGGLSYGLLHNKPLPYSYDDNFNKRWVLEAVLSPPADDAPIDLSIKSDAQSEEDEDISVDDFREEPPESQPQGLAQHELLRRATPLDLTTKVV